MAQPSESQIAEVYLDNWNPDGGWVRTQAQEEVGREERGDYSAVFYLVHAIHGKFDAKEALDDNASLLVLKIEPKTTDPSKTFLRFKVTLKCTRTRSSVEHPYIAAADPALGGERVLDDFIINKSKDLSYGASLSAQGSAVPLSGGVNMSKSQGETYNLRERHTISARVDKTNARSVRDCAWWELRAAPTASQGIGDFFTVAVVIHRSKGQQFTITADTEADLGGISDKLRRFEGIFHRRKEGTPLGTYGPVGNKPMTPTPAGIDPNNLRCSTDSPEVVRKSLCVGVHLPETEAPLATLGAISAPSTDTLAHGTNTTEQLAPQQTTGSFINEDIITRPLNSNATARQDIPESGAIPSESKSQAGVHPSAERPRTDSKAELPQIAPTIEQPSSRTYLASPSPRADRHLKMAALYQRLAQLHREEALEAMGDDATTYVDEVERNRWRLGLL